MNKYKLTPIDLNPDDWKYSSQQDEIEVFAISEESARNLAARSFNNMAKATRGETGSAPWKRKCSVRCEILEENPSEEKERII
jgi:hypothetical protein